MANQLASSRETADDAPIDVEVVAEEVEIVDIPTALAVETSEPEPLQTKIAGPKRVQPASAPVPPMAKAPESEQIETTHTTPPAEALEIYIGPDGQPPVPRQTPKPGPFAAFKAFVSRLAPGRKKSGKTGVVARKSKTTAIMKKSG